MLCVLVVYDHRMFHDPIQCCVSWWSTELFTTLGNAIIIIIIIIIDNFCIALFSGVPILTALYILQHFLSFTNIIHIIMTTNNV